MFGEVPTLTGAFTFVTGIGAGGLAAALESGQLNAGSAVFALRAVESALTDSMREGEDEFAIDEGELQKFRDMLEGVSRETTMPDSSKVVLGGLVTGVIASLRANSDAMDRAIRHIAPQVTTARLSQSGESLIHPPTAFSNKAHIKSIEEYGALYRRSVEDPEGFWGNEARGFRWFKSWDRVISGGFDTEDVRFSFFEGARTNLSVNCLDRHVKEGSGERTAIIWEGNEPGDVRKIAYAELLRDVNKFSNVLRDNGVKKGDIVTIYMPMVPELVTAVLACARIGAVHSVVFGGFSADSLKARIMDGKSRFLITADGAFRGAKKVDLKGIADEALAMSRAEGHEVGRAVVLKRTGGDVAMREGRDVWWHDEMSKAADFAEPEQMDAEDPLFMLYTSGSTGKPKGVLHTTAGYMVYTATTFKNIFDYREGDVFWCTADIGWVTGHSYIVYGPLLNGATEVMFEGIPTYPDPARFWDIVERHKVTQIYTAPTAIRALMREGESWPARHDLSSLRLLGTVGEPINPAAWRWYHQNIGHRRAPIVDTWWQTETGGILVTPLPGAIPTKPGSVTLPFFGVRPKIVREDGTPATPGEDGLLVIEKPWPGMMRTVYGDHERFKRTYFERFPGFYWTGDRAMVDDDGYIWIRGRADDIMIVSGHNLSTAEIESAIVASPEVSEAAVVPIPDEITGQAVYAYVVLKSGVVPTDELRADIIGGVRKKIGPVATPKYIQFSDGLPKTRSGKIMRRILRKIAEGSGDITGMGDTTTLADPSVIESIIAGRRSG